ncbi:FGGY-family carbohydrate kinase [Gemmobacter sp. 24YEA27]|uniref:FGGY-family carbohydrate kinase n=1 Tax=Gemmobacter sp. 24YEA27 TaxID=3040672 RepID=UPI0024B38C3D|nr:FGGY-family carbohydrate kinase [Gemmobacter sp. 24YEA27]
MIASCLGAGVVSGGDVLLKFGGAVDILTATDVLSPDPRLFLDYHLIPGLWMPNGCMSTGGSVLNWSWTPLRPGSLRSMARVMQHLMRWRQTRRPAERWGLPSCPICWAEKTPLHDPAARGALNGLTLSHDLGHIWRAILESYAYAIRHHIEIFRVGIRRRGASWSRMAAQNPRSGWGLSPMCSGNAAPAWRASGLPAGRGMDAAVGLGAAEWGGITAFTSQDRLFTPDPPAIGKSTTRAMPHSVISIAAWTGRSGDGFSLEGDCLGYRRNPDRQ